MFILVFIDCMVICMIINFNEIDNFCEIMDGIVFESNVVYRNLVFDNFYFYDYFFEVSLIKEVLSLNIGFWLVVCKIIIEILGLCVILWVFLWL